MGIGWPSTEIVWALLCTFAGPLFLFASQWLLTNVSMRFLVSALATVGCYTIAMMFFIAGTNCTVQMAAGFALVIAVLIFILGFWGLLTRGYSVAILIALAEIGDNARIELVYSHYGRGKGLRWFMEKRLKGLLSFGATDEREDYVCVTPTIGAIIYLFYRGFMACFRLRQFG